MSEIAHDPGIYDEICTYARLQTDAETAIVIILNGNKGDGFSVQSYAPDTQEMLPKLLESIAQDIRAQAGRKIHE